METLTTSIYEHQNVPRRRPQTCKPKILDDYNIKKVSSLKSIDQKPDVFERLYNRRPKSAMNTRNGFFNGSCMPRSPIPLNSLIAVLKDSMHKQLTEKSNSSFEIGSKYPGVHAGNLSMISDDLCKADGINSPQSNAKVFRPTVSINAYKIYQAVEQFSYDDFDVLNKNTNKESLYKTQQSRVEKSKIILRRRPKPQNAPSLVIKKKPINKSSSHVSFNEKVRNIFNSTVPYTRENDSEEEDLEIAKEKEKVSITSIIRRSSSMKSNSPSLLRPSLTISKVVKPSLKSNNESQNDEEAFKSSQPSPFPHDYLNPTHEASSYVSSNNTPKRQETQGNKWMSIGLSPVSLVEVKAKGRAKPQSPSSIWPKSSSNDRKPCNQCFSLPKMIEISPFGTYVKGKKVQYQAGSMFTPTKNFSMTPNHFLNSD
ncbi:unnamed protein product [Blepharisma stoltei]|uniref:Exophilin 5 n=1 Tax=Blepharisma stoltei TaxID=1481888 RepID=A0AAU9J549_9CILI|nr:unnamed protein product [Blepharisma stoltei]